MPSQIQSIEEAAADAIAGELTEISKVDDVYVFMVDGRPHVSMHLRGDAGDDDSDALRLIGLAIKQAGQRLMDEFEFGRH